jgi:hypothetical protein
LLVAAYALPAAAVWAVVGLLVNALPLQSAALVLITSYATYYGLVEATGIRGLRSPGAAWQVPQSFVRGDSRWRRVLVWGSILGPGFATRNPYAGFALLPVIVAAVGNIRTGVFLALAMGIVHAIARALALLRDAHEIETADYLQAVLKSMYWRVFDGFALLVIAGVGAITCAHVL